MSKLLLGAFGAMGFLAVALGAFGAHGLRAHLSGLPDGSDRLAVWQTAAHYHLAHALALGVLALLAERSPGAARFAGIAFVLGILVFSGSLYALALTGVRTLGAVTPLGGLLFLAGWAALFVAAVRA